MGSGGKEREKVRVGRKKGEEGKGEGTGKRGKKRWEEGGGRDKERRKLKWWENTCLSKGGMGEKGKRAGMERGR